LWALAGLVVVCDRRGELFGMIGAWDLLGYNRRAGEPLPFILCVVDEALDLALSGGREVLGHLKVLAMRGRSAGVFLWAATQHASAVEGLPRVVAANMARRLVFRVVDGNAARVAGCPGAQDLPVDCPGRMLARLEGGPVELQGYFVSDEALEGIARGVTGRPAGLALSDGERALVRFAVEELGGAFIIGRLAEARLEGWTAWGIRKLAERWERRGWLTAPAHATDPRRVTPELCDLCGGLEGRGLSCFDRIGA